ncbi:MAG: Smr/MutS family protein [Sphingobium sp.]
MAGRRLSPEEQQIWAKVARSVTPLPGRHPLPVDAGVAADTAKSGVLTGPPVSQRISPAPPRKREPVPLLDDGWERRIARGTLIPDMTVDLHGHSLDAAHRRLNQSLAMAVAQDARVLLVITGTPRPATVVAAGQKPRGAIRAEIGDWLALSGHADSIASVRVAHLRHGGQGALYVILRRKKMPHSGLKPLG